jgi:hypothetical protein
VPDIFVRFKPNLQFLGTFDVEVLHIKFHKNPYSGGNSEICGRTDMKKLTDAYGDLCERTPKQYVLRTYYGQFTSDLLGDSHTLTE